MVQRPSVLQLFIPSALRCFGSSELRCFGSSKLRCFVYLSLWRFGSSALWHFRSFKLLCTHFSGVILPEIHDLLTRIPWQSTTRIYFGCLSSSLSTNLWSCGSYTTCPPWRWTVPNYFRTSRLWQVHSPVHTRVKSRALTSGSNGYWSFTLRSNRWDMFLSSALPFLTRHWSNGPCSSPQPIWRMLSLLLLSFWLLPSWNFC
jgi:hypothetical protein